MARPCHITWVLGLLALCTLAACEDTNDLGQYCFVGADLNPECESGLCFKQGGYRCTDPEVSCVGDPEDNPQLKINSVCTRECIQNSDCKPSDGDVNGCNQYVCQEQGAETGWGERCLCVCLDFIRDDSGEALTEAAFDASEMACRL